MINQLEQSLEQMEQAFTLLQKHVPPPIKVPKGNGFVYRYKEESLEQAIILKLARVITGLRSALALLKLGYFQEVGSLQRIIDDFCEEIAFLSLAKITETRNKHHDRFLEGFYMELFEDPFKPEESLSQKRPIVSRKQIRESIESSAESLTQGGVNPMNVANEAIRTVSNMYNSFTHGGASQILEMYGGEPEHFHLRGMRGTQRDQEHLQDLWNQFFRGCLALSYSSIVFNDQVALQLSIEISNQLQNNG